MISAKSAKIFSRLHPPGSEEEAIVLGRARPRKAGGRIAAGHKAKAIGDGWEGWLKDQHALASAAGIAHLRAVGAPHKRTGPGGERIVIVGNGPADFQGAIAAEPGQPWRILAVEAKSYQGRLQRDDLAAHQREDLAWAESVGGVGLVVVELHDERGLSLGAWAVPWGVLDGAEGESRGLWKRSTRVLGDGTPKRRVVDSASVGPDELVGWETSPVYLARFAGGGQ